jgi:hypothetical protein
MTAQKPAWTLAESLSLFVRHPHHRSWDGCD